MLKLMIQYFGHLIQRADSLEKTLMLGKTEDKRRRGWKRMRWLNSITDSMDRNLSKLQAIMKDRGVWHVSFFFFFSNSREMTDLFIPRHNLFFLFFFFFEVVVKASLVAQMVKNPLAIRET